MSTCYSCRRSTFSSQPPCMAAHTSCNSSMFSSQQPCMAAHTQYPFLAAHIQYPCLAAHIQYPCTAAHTQYPGLAAHTNCNSNYRRSSALHWSLQVLMCMYTDTRDSYTHKRREERDTNKSCSFKRYI